MEGEKGEDPCARALKGESAQDFLMALTSRREVMPAILTTMMLLSNLIFSVLAH